MNSYLSNIAARTMGKDAQIRLQPTPVISAADHGINLHSRDLDTEQDIIVQDRYESESMVPVQPVLTQKIFRSGATANMEGIAPEQHNESAYFANYAERLGNYEISHFGREWSFGTRDLRIVRPLQQIREEKTASGDSEKVGTYNEKDGPLSITETNVSQEQSDFKAAIRPEGPVRKRFIIRDPGHSGTQVATENPDDAIKTKKQQIQPSVGEERDKPKKKLPLEPVVEHSNRSRLTFENSGQVQRMIYKTPPRLVIGKIIVEILPSPAPAPPKAVTGILQPSPPEGHFHSNKLIFGLGQL